MFVSRDAVMEFVYSSLPNPLVNIVLLLLAAVILLSSAVDGSIVGKKEVATIDVDMVDKKDLRLEILGAATTGRERVSSSPVKVVLPRVIIVAVLVLLMISVLRVLVIVILLATFLPVDVIDCRALQKEEDTSS